MSKIDNQPLYRWLVLSEPAAQRFLGGVGVPQDWERSLEFDLIDSGLTSVAVGPCKYIFCGNEKASDAHMFILIGEGTFFTASRPGNQKIEALERAIKGCALILSGDGEIPFYWRPYTRTRFKSFQATSLAKGQTDRLVVWSRLRPAEFPCAIVFSATRGQRDYESLSIEDIRSEVDGIIAELGAIRNVSLISQKEAPNLNAFALNDLKRSEKSALVSQGLKLTQLMSRLTREQHRFVNAPLDGPVRLKGAAGTGKSLAMIVKIVHEATKKALAGEDFRFLFLTHNSDAAQSARDDAAMIDEGNALSGDNSHGVVQFDTLLGHALNSLGDNFGDIEPVSYDALDGKKFQMILLWDAIRQYRTKGWILRRGNSSTPIIRGIEASSDGDFDNEFCWDLMNEISTNLDADAVLDDVEKRRKYVAQRRRLRSLMDLPTEEDRRVVLDVYDLYRSQFRSQRLISVDNIIGDFVRYLDGFVWDAKKDKLGFDAIFVDEYHLFSFVERSAFLPMLRRRQDTLPNIIMAMDPRQSPKVVLLGKNSTNEGFPFSFERFPKSSGLKNFTFEEVFRYTPQIAKVLTHINQAYPETDLEEEWLPSVPRSVTEAGPLPRAREFANRRQMLDAAIDIGLKLKKANRTKSVALLSMSIEAFELISTAGIYRDKVFPVSSRDSTSTIRFAGGRLTLSIPEYVAGVQFDSVIVIDANERDSYGRLNSVERSRFGEELYLAASRARQNVFFLSDSEKGGLTAVIKSAIEQGLIVQDIPGAPS